MKLKLPISKQLHINLNSKQTKVIKREGTYDRELKQTHQNKFVNL